MNTRDTFDYTLSSTGVLASLHVANGLLWVFMCLLAGSGMLAWEWNTLPLSLSLGGVLYLQHAALDRHGNWRPRRTMGGMLAFMAGLLIGYLTFFTQADMAVFSVISATAELAVWVDIMATSMLLGVMFSSICCFIWIGLFFDAHESWRYHQQCV